MVGLDMSWPSSGRALPRPARSASRLRRCWSTWSPPVRSARAAAGADHDGWFRWPGQPVRDDHVPAAFSRRRASRCGADGNRQVQQVSGAAGPRLPLPVTTSRHGRYRAPVRHLAHREHQLVEQRHWRAAVLGGTGAAEAAEAAVGAVGGNGAADGQAAARLPRCTPRRGMPGRGARSRTGRGRGRAVTTRQASRRGRSGRHVATGRRRGAVSIGRQGKGHARRAA